jgi:hypothetical protein
LSTALALPTATVAGEVMRTRTLPQNKRTGAGGGYVMTLAVSAWDASDGRAPPAAPVKIQARPPLVPAYGAEPAVGAACRCIVRLAHEDPLVLHAIKVAFGTRADQ